MGVVLSVYWVTDQCGLATGTGVSMPAVEELLDACPKEQLLKVAEHFEIEIPSQGC